VFGRISAQYAVVLPAAGGESIVLHV